MARLADAFDRLTTEGDRLVIDAPRQWSQGRTLYGGMTAALCHEAVRRLSPVSTPLRSAQFLFAGPAAGSLTFKVDVLRAGRSSTTLAVDCLSEGAPAARATFAFGADRDTIVADPAPTRRLPAQAPEDCPTFLDWTGGFHDNFDLRLAEGSPLFSGGATDFTVWVKFRDAPGANPTSALLALADALPPAAMTRFPSPAPISTISWTIDLTHPPASLDGWHLLRSVGDHTQDGYSMQAMELRDEAGTHLASGRQAVAIFI